MILVERGSRMPRTNRIRRNPQPVPDLRLSPSVRGIGGRLSFQEAGKMNEEWCGYCGNRPATAFTKTSRGYEPICSVCLQGLRDDAQKTRAFRVAYSYQERAYILR